MKITGTKKDSLNIRRLQRVTDKDRGRPILKGIYVDKSGENIWATNGFIGIAIPAPDGFAGAEGKVIDLDISAGEFDTEAKEIEGKFPSVTVCRPNREPQAEIVVNANFLKEVGALAGDQPVKIRIFGPKMPIEIQSTTTDLGNTPVFALVMPMHPTEDKKEYDPPDYD